jgi:hypothetical protein
MNLPSAKGGRGDSGEDATAKRLRTSASVTGCTAAESGHASMTPINKFRTHPKSHANRNEVCIGNSHRVSSYLAFAGIVTMKAVARWKNKLQAGIRAGLDLTGVKNPFLLAQPKKELTKAGKGILEFHLQIDVARAIANAKAQRRTEPRGILNPSDKCPRSVSADGLPGR